MAVEFDDKAREVAPARAERTSSAPGGAHPLLRLQRAAGNRAVVARLAEVRRAPDDEPVIESLFGDEPAGPVGGEKPAFDNSRGGKWDGTGNLFSGGFDEDGKKALGGTSGAKEVDKPAPSAPKAFDRAKADADLAALAKRLERFPALQGSSFLGFMQGYVAAAAKGDDALAQEEMEMAIACLKSLNAFTIGNVVYARQGANTDAGTLADLAEEAMQGVVLWSKLNKYKAIETVAGGEKGNSLEASAAGSLFDDLSFGMDYGSHAVLRKQWSLVSQSFVTEARGVVHAQVLEGIDPNSVLTTTEWPIISKLMRQGVVFGFVVHIFEYEPGKDGAPGELVEIGQRTIRHPDEWGSLPSVTNWNEGLQDYSATQELDAATGKQKDSAYKQRQGTAHFGELERHKRQQEMAESKARFVEV